MLINETQQKWSNIISEELGVKDQNKLGWMSKMAQIHELYEAQQNPTMSIDGGIYSTPLNTMGMGNPMMPEPAGGFKPTTGVGDTGADFHHPLYKNGSGDIPMSTLNMALEVAAMTIGLELVPVIPAPGPFAMLSYMDFPYAGGKLGRLNETWADGKGPEEDNKPIYVKMNLKLIENTEAGAPIVLLPNQKYEIYREGTYEGATVNYVFTGVYLAKSRIDADPIFEVKSATAQTGWDNEAVKKGDVSIADIFNGLISDDKAFSIRGIFGDAPEAAEPSIKVMKDRHVRPELVATAADHIQNFSNFAKRFDENGNEIDNLDPMTRAENETGVGNTIGARMFTKLVQMGAYEVTGSVTRQQLQDMPLYGVDVIGKILEQMQNEISQAINNRILDRLFKLGVTNAVTQHRYQGLDLNLYIDGDVINNQSKSLSDICHELGLKFEGIDNQDHSDEFPEVKNARVFAAAENVTTNQRRIMSRLLAAANVIANVSRRGRATWAVTNTQILSALQDASAFVVAPMTNTLTQDGSQSLYFAGSVAGLNIYVDPYMTWNDTRICVGRKSDGNTPGVVFMPYILCDTVQTVVEGTMAPKLLCNSRFAIVDAGFHPEQNYLTFVVDCQEGII